MEWWRETIWDRAGNKGVKMKMEKMVNDFFSTPETFGDKFREVESEREARIDNIVYLSRAFGYREALTDILMLKETSGRLVKKIEGMAEKKYPIKESK